MKKVTISLLFVALIICSPVLTLNFITVNAQTGTNVSGIITSDTTWTQTNSPYTFTGNVLVNNNVTLIIQPGTTVNFNGYYLRVNGTLNARGSPNNAITFNIIGSSDSGSAIQFTSSSIGWNEQTNSGSIIENTIIHSTWASSTILINNAQPKLNNCTISCGSGTAIRVTTWNLPYGTPISLVPTISNSSITTGGSAIDIDCNASICNNTIYNCFKGINIYGGNALIYGNTIMGCEIGIRSYDTNVTIQRNLLLNNTVGLEIGHYDTNFENTPVPVITNNTLSENQVALEINGNFKPFIRFNNIQNSSENNTLLVYGAPWSYSSGDIIATYNWWGTNDVQAINNTIHDFKNDFNLGMVDFVPYLDAPNIYAPTYVNATASTGGSISPRGVIKLSYGDDMTFSIEANNGYHIVDVLVNGSSVGAVNSYTVQNITGATTISAISAPDPTPTPTPTANPTTQPTSGPTSNPTSNPTTQPTANPTNSSIESPTSSPSPSPTIPEFTAVMLLSLFMAVLSIALVLRKRVSKDALT